MPLPLKTYISYPDWRGQVRVKAETSEHSYRTEVSLLRPGAGRFEPAKLWDWRSIDESLEAVFEVDGVRHFLALRVSTGLLWGHNFQCTIDNENVNIENLDSAANKEGLKRLLGGRDQQ